MDCSASLLYDQMSQVKAIEQKMRFESSKLVLKNMTLQVLETAKDMFIYLNTCPGDLKPWFLFYKDLFQTQSPENIILTLNRINQSDYFKNLAQTLLKRVTTMFSPHYNVTEGK